MNKLFFDLMDKLLPYIAAKRLHLKLFLFVAHFNPIVWGCTIMLLLFICGVKLLDGSYGWYILFFMSIITFCMAPFALWLIWGCYCVPYKKAINVVCSIHSKRTLAVHLGRSMPPGRTFLKAALASVSLARKIKFSRIELRSPIFGDPDREIAWVKWISKSVQYEAPNAVVRVVDRDPLNRYMTKRYLQKYGEKPRSSFTEDNRLRAARIFIENF